MIPLVVTILLDISVVKVYDLVTKSFISAQAKLVLFSINTSICLALQLVLIKYLMSTLKKRGLNKKLRVTLWYRIALISLCVLGTLMGLLMFQQFYNNYYNTLIPIFIVIISYGTAVGFVIWLSTLFISWHKSYHNPIVFLYFVSMLLIAFNLLVTATITTFKINDRPDEIREFVGGSMVLSVGKYVFLENTYQVSSIASFVSIWVTTALLLSYYRDKLIINAIVYWIILSLPFVYFLASHLYWHIISDVLSSYLTADPVTVSIILTTFLSLSKPIVGLTFAVAFWKISSVINYEKNIKAYMIISGWGILLIFAADQGLVQTQLQSPYPPFGLATITVLIIAAYLMLLGIYNSATLVSANNELRRSIYKHASESKLLGAIGHAEMEKEIQNAVKQVNRDKYELDKELEEPVELDEIELEKYIEFVVKEVRKTGQH
jgi:hypothetical protein